VQQFFVRISLVWAAVLLLNTGVVLWLSSPRRCGPSSRAHGCHLVAHALGVFCSIYGFILTMRSDGRTVQWAKSSVAAPVLAPLPGQL